MRGIRVRGEVRIGKRQETEQKTISETVCHEDVEIEELPNPAWTLLPNGQELSATNRRNAAVLNY